MSKKKIGVGNTMPAGQAKPMGTSKSKKASDVATLPMTEKALDSANDAPLPSSTVEPSTGSDAPATEDTKMQITFNKSTKERKSTSVVYSAANGLRGSLRMAKTFFKGGVAPDTLVIDSDAFSEPKVKLTAEQRKEARKNAPKQTPAEKLAKLEERAAKLRAKVATTPTA
jgi:hypothetical protein